VLLNKGLYFNFATTQTKGHAQSLACRRSPVSMCSCKWALVMDPGELEDCRAVDPVSPLKT
jgi:hypothetical protein